MTFHVIIDPDKLRQLGTAGLLWYKRPGRPGGTWQPSQNQPHHWTDMTEKVLEALCQRGVYSILLED